MQKSRKFIVEIDMSFVHAGNPVAIGQILHSVAEQMNDYIPVPFTVMEADGEPFCIEGRIVPEGEEDRNRAEIPVNLRFYTSPDAFDPTPRMEIDKNHEVEATVSLARPINIKDGNDVLR